MKRFYGIGDKYSRNIWMDAYHPDFYDTIAIDSRIQKVTAALGHTFKPSEYEEHERFYQEIARNAGLQGWELDRLLYQYTSHFLTAIATGAHDEQDEHPREIGGLLTIRDEVFGTLSSISRKQVFAAEELFADRDRRWFCSGQGRSGLVAQMSAMRLMHLGFEAHAVGEATASSLTEGDATLVFSKSGETPITIHFARLARDSGARILAITTSANSTLGNLANDVIEVPTAETSQFGGSLFEQSALLIFDAMIFDLTYGDSQAHEKMQNRHANLE